MAHAAGSKGKDFYKILNVSRTATKLEIKKAYRKLALALHPDRTDGCPDKADAFKQANEAYDVLSDHSKRSQYDNIHGHHRRRSPPPNYRKVYSPRAPPGFKTFDHQRHYDMHYGDGMMKEAVSDARKRAERASSRNSGYQYQSPLGKGFSFQSKQDHNPYSKRSRQGPPPRHGNNTYEYEEAHYYDMDGGTDMKNARRIVRHRETVRERMDERRRERIERRKTQQEPREESGGCAIM